MKFTYTNHKTLTFHPIFVPQAPHRWRAVGLSRPPWAAAASKVSRVRHNNSGAGAKGGLVRPFKMDQKKTASLVIFCCVRYLIWAMFWTYWKLYIVSLTFFRMKYTEMFQWEVPWLWVHWLRHAYQWWNGGVVQSQAILGSGSLTWLSLPVMQGHYIQ